jgi:hypothetical protein
MSLDKLTQLQDHQRIVVACAVCVNHDDRQLIRASGRLCLLHGIGEPGRDGLPVLDLDAELMVCDVRLIAPLPAGDRDASSA